MFNRQNRNYELNSRAINTAVVIGNSKDIIFSFIKKEKLNYKKILLIARNGSNRSGICASRSRDAQELLPYIM